MKIAFFEVEDWEIKHIKDKLKGHKLIFFNDKLNNNIKKVKDVDIISTFIYSKLDKQVIDQFKKLKYIATMSTGFDHIDLVECKKRKIIVSNVPFYGENTVAEHAFALLLGLSRRIYESHERTKLGVYDYNGLRGFDLKDKTLGVIGTGHIGTYTIKIAHGFGMNVIAYDKFKNNKLQKEFNFKYVTLKTLLQKSDVITLHLPYNKQTHHTLNKNNMKYIKRGAYIINTARGALIETDALVKAIDKGIIAGAGLDVLESEPYIKEEKQLLSKHFDKKDMLTVIEDHILMHNEHVLITPHNAFNSKEALLRILNTTIDNVKSFIMKKPINLVEVKK